MMKTIKLLLLFLLPLLLGQGVKGQEYHKLLQDNVDWDVLSANGSMNPFCGYVGGGRFFLRGDTTIQGNDYKIINCIKIISPEPGPFCPPFFVTQDTVFRQGYIREDTIAKKVFVYDPFDGDALLYDFSLSVGDTLFTNNCGDLIVDSIGTITLFNSETRKIFFFLGSEEYFIEGIGGSQGLNNAMCWFESMYEPFCVLKNGVAIYNLSYTMPLSCFQVMSIDNYQVSGNFSIYPNPATDFLNIETQLPEEPSLMAITDITGRVVYQSVFSNRIDVSQLPKGIYFLQIHSKQGMIYSGKVVKQ